jgi:hypothetical protein
VAREGGVHCLLSQQHLVYSLDLVFDPCSETNGKPESSVMDCHRKRKSFTRFSTHGNDNDGNFPARPTRGVELTKNLRNYLLLQF